MTAELGKIDELGAPATGPRGRLEAVDMLRGLVMVIMALDHVRDFFHIDALRFDPTDLTQTSVVLFLTRFVTHFCAPTFVFLSGASVWFQRARGKALPDLSRFLLTRGLWLIVLELTLVSFAIGLKPGLLFLQVIWCIGLGMVLLAGLVWIPRAAVLALGAAIVAGHGLLAAVDPERLGALAPVLALAIRPNLIPLGPGLNLFVLYPFLAWLGILLLGYGLGSVFLLDKARRTRSLLALGGGAIALFVVIRAINGYGDPAPWSVQKDAAFTVLSFLNVSKYPPSLDYVLVTLGPTLLMVLALEHLRGPAAKVLVTYGRVPLFYYLLHFYLAHLSAAVVGMAMGYPYAAFVWGPGGPSVQALAGWGVPLGVTYLIWLAIVAALYPFCLWWAGLKARRGDWWLSYL
jgi:uncharacterized membrane protein